MLQGDLELIGGSASRSVDTVRSQLVSAASDNCRIFLVNRFGSSNSAPRDSSSFGSHVDDDSSSFESRAGICGGRELTGQASFLSFARQLTCQEKKEIQLGASLLLSGCLEQARMLKSKPGRPPKTLALAAAGQVTVHAPRLNCMLTASLDQA
eukprot:366390-Chlamydomonas_euryale.AAC.25